MTLNKLKAGAAFGDITPKDSQFLYGYPYVERMSTGTHDPLLSSALYLTDGKEQILFISNDVIYVSKQMVARIRQAVSKKKGIPASNILIAATHTHSGPVTVDSIRNELDPIVPKADKSYLEFMENAVVGVACQAVENAAPAEAAFVLGDAAGVGTNRHNPVGAKDMEVPAVLLRNKDKRYIGCLLVCNMHPTILHEDSKLYSADFPYFVRERLQQELLGKDCPVVYFTGTAGNQSPRHVTKANTFEEARRIGSIVADSILSKLSANAPYSSELSLQSAQTTTDLPKRKFPAIETARQQRDKARERFQELKKASENPKEIRTAEVDWFGSEKLLLLSELAQTERMEKTWVSCLPAEIQVIKIGNWSFIAWSGEVFVEYGLALKKQFKNIALITYANGELQGYITTQEAQEKGFYEAGNSFFDYTSGEIMSAKTVELLKALKQ